MTSDEGRNEISCVAPGNVSCLDQTLTRAGLEEKEGSSREDLVQPVVDDRIRQRQVAELTMAVRPFGRREDTPCHGAAHAPAEVLEELHRDGALALADQGEARAANVPEGIPDPELARALEPGRDAVHPKATERRLEAVLDAGR